MKRALLVIDVQNEYFTGKMPVTYPENSLDNIKRAMDVASDKNIPVILVQHTAPQDNAAVFRKGSGEWNIHTEVAAKKHSHIVEKNLPGSFTNTNLEELLRELQVDTITISGYMTQMCCDTTARQAMHMGFTVEFLSDATGTLSLSNYAGTISAKDLHQAILIVQAARFSQVLTTDEWIDKVK